MNANKENVISSNNSIHGLTNINGFVGNPRHLKFWIIAHSRQTRVSTNYCHSVTIHWPFAHHLETIWPPIVVLIVFTYRISFRLLRWLVSFSAMSWQHITRAIYNNRCIYYIANTIDAISISIPIRSNNIQYECMSYPSKLYSALLSSTEPSLRKSAPPLATIDCHNLKDQLIWMPYYLHRYSSVSIEYIRKCIILIFVC